MSHIFGIGTDIIPFYVLRSPKLPRQRILFLAPTFTYMAYANYRWQVHNPFAEVSESNWTTLDRGDAFLQEHPSPSRST